MLLSRPARWLLIFTALLLPLQSMAAVAMSLCRHDAPPAAAAAAAAHDHCAHEQAAPAAPQPLHDAGCDDCGVCHLASSGYLAASEIRTDVAPYPHVFEEGPAAARPSHIPEPPRYPPRRSA